MSEAERDQRLLYVETGRFKRALARGGGKRFALRKTFAPETRAVDRERLTVRFRLSTAAVDRDGDRLAVEGWELAGYRANPVVLWAHDYRQPPVAKALSIGPGDGALVAEAAFTPRDLYPFGHMTFRLYAEGFLNAVSVGFRPLDWAWAAGESRTEGIDFARQELLEFSCVPVPANPEALVAARAKGIDTAPLADWAEARLDGEGSDVPLPRGQLERLRRAALGRSPVAYHLGRDAQADLARRNLAAIRAQAAAPGLSPDELAGLVQGAVTRAVNRLTGRLD